MNAKPTAASWMHLCSLAGTNERILPETSTARRVTCHSAVSSPSLRRKETADPRLGRPSEQRKPGRGQGDTGCADRSLRRREHWSTSGAADIAGSLNETIRYRLITVNHLQRRKALPNQKAAHSLEHGLSNVSGMGGSVRRNGAADRPVCRCRSSTAARKPAGVFPQPSRRLECRWSPGETCGQR